MDKKVLIFTFLISLLGHCLFLFIPRLTLTSPRPKELKDISIEIEIEKISKKAKVKSKKLEVKKQKLLKKRRQKTKNQKPKTENIKIKELLPIQKKEKIGKKPQWKKKIKKPQVKKKIENREQKTENRKQRIENRKQKQRSENRKPKTENREKFQFKRKKVKKPYPSGHRQVTKKGERGKGKGEREKKISIQKKREEKKISPVIKEVSEADFVLENGRKEALLRYQDRVKQKIKSCRRYPRWAKKQGFEGIVYLGFTILPNGEVRDIRIVRPSQFDILNKEALATVQRASPFLPIPRNIERSRIEMQVAIVFEMQ